MSSQVSVQGPAVRLVFERYDSGLYSPDKVVTMLHGLAIKTPQSFVDILNQFSRSRNLPYREFLKALTSETHQFPAEGLSVETIRQFNLRSAPVAAAAKAPFDTITENSDNSAANAPRQRRYLPPAAHLESHEEEPCRKEHCKASDAVFGRTVDLFGEDASGPTPREVDERKLKLIAGHGDIITWQPNYVEADDDISAHQVIPVSERKIAEVNGEKSLLTWSDSPVVAAASTPLSTKPNMLAFDENFERNKNTAVLDVKILYPFATEGDDLAAARTRYHRQRIHKISASCPQ
jgi:hypothetical protein